jgi:hypothetical protein
MAAIQNIVIDQGTTFSFIFNITNVDGTAKDLTSYTGSAHLRKSYYTNTYTAFTVAKDNLEGEITISLTATQTSALKAGRYVYDVEILSNVETLRVLEGIITVTPEATR